MKEQIVDAALELAEQTSWESVRLSHVASRMGIGLDQIRKHFAEKEDIVDAWFDRADSALLNSIEQITAHSEMERRVHCAMMVWFDALSAHRRPTRQMIINKFEPGHLHFQVNGALRVSRTVQWMREAVELQDSLPWRAFSEAGMTGIYLATFAFWMFDTSSGSRNTRAFLSKRLNCADRMLRRVRRVDGLSRG